MKTTRLLLTTALLAVAATSAQAATITVTGGDPGEGYAPLASVFAAVNAGGAGGLTVQGVTFAASSPNITISTPFTTPAGYTPFAPTTAK